MSASGEGLGRVLTVALGLCLVCSMVVSTAAVPQRLVIDYAIGYVRPTGISRKVFKLRTVDLGPGERLQLSRSQVIRDFSTRRHHPGHHAVELLVNGAVLAVTGFDLGS